jgi:hypothetical protein
MTKGRDSSSLDLDSIKLLCFGLSYTASPSSSGMLSSASMLYAMAFSKASLVILLRAGTLVPECNADGGKNLVLAAEETASDASS